MTQVPHDRLDNATRVNGPRDLVYKAAELTDLEAQQAFKVVFDASSKYSRKTSTAKNLEAMRDEILYRLAEVGILAEVDPAPCLYGNPPEVEIIGKVAGDDMHKYGFDHEKKAHEVIEAKKRGEDWRGQKERHRG